MYLFFDTETTGFPSKSKPLDHEDQPHVMQLAWKLVTPERKTVRSWSALVRCNVEPHEKALAVHGLTSDLTLQHGVHAYDAARVFEDAMSAADHIVCHGTFFDVKVIDVLLRRNNLATIDLMETPAICTMQMAKDRDYPSSSLNAVYKQFTGNNITKAHDAWADTEACEEIFFRMGGRA